METETTEVVVPNPPVAQQLGVVVGSAVAAFFAGKLAEKGLNAALSAIRNRRG